MKTPVLGTIIFLLLASSSCSNRPPEVNLMSGNMEEKKLDFLADLERSILQINCSAYYESYIYSPPPSFEQTVPQQSLLIKKNYSTNSVAGTGLVLLQQADKNLILTCHHMFDFRDTVKVYFLNDQKQISNYLQTLSIKFGQTIYVTHKNGTISRGKILASDEENDIALIETEADKNTLSEAPFRGLLDAKIKLSLGQEIYLLGFPKGHFMVSRGLASPSKYKNKFLVDVSFNRGFSGGIAIAFDQRTGNYHYVGMANSAAYDSQIAIVPSEDIQNIELYLNQPYKDELFIKELKIINYGITFVTKSDVIIDFLKRNADQLKYSGHYDLSVIMH